MANNEREKPRVVRYSDRFAGSASEPGQSRRRERSPDARRLFREKIDRFAGSGPSFEARFLSVPTLPSELADPNGPGWDLDVLAKHFPKNRWVDDAVRDDRKRYSEVVRNLSAIVANATRLYPEYAASKDPEKSKDSRFADVVRAQLLYNRKQALETQARAAYEDGDKLDVMERLYNHDEMLANVTADYEWKKWLDSEFGTSPRHQKIRRKIEARTAGVSPMARIGYKDLWYATRIEELFGGVAGSNGDPEYSEEYESMGNRIGLIDSGYQSGSDENAAVRFLKAMSNEDRGQLLALTRNDYRENAYRTIIGKYITGWDGEVVSQVDRSITHDSGSLSELDKSWIRSAKNMRGHHTEYTKSMKDLTVPDQTNMASSEGYARFVTQGLVQFEDRGVTHTTDLLLRDLVIEAMNQMSGNIIEFVDLPDGSKRKVYKEVDWLSGNIKPKDAELCIEMALNNSRFAALIDSPRTRGYLAALVRHEIDVTCWLPALPSQKPQEVYIDGDKSKGLTQESQNQINNYNAIVDIRTSLTQGKRAMAGGLGNIFGINTSGDVTFKKDLPEDFTNLVTYDTVPANRNEDILIRDDTGKIIKVIPAGQYYKAHFGNWFDMNGFASQYVDAREFLMQEPEVIVGMCKDTRVILTKGFDQIYGSILAARKFEAKLIDWYRQPRGVSDIHYMTELWNELRFINGDRGRRLILGKHSEPAEVRFATFARSTHIVHENTTHLVKVVNLEASLGVLSHRYRQIKNLLTGVTELSSGVVNLTDRKYAGQLIYELAGTSASDLEREGIDTSWVQTPWPLLELFVKMNPAFRGDTKRYIRAMFMYANIHHEVDSAGNFIDENIYESVKPIQARYELLNMNANDFESEMSRYLNRELPTTEASEFFNNYEECLPSATREDVVERIVRRVIREALDRHPEESLKGLHEDVRRQNGRWSVPFNLDLVYYWLKGARIASPVGDPVRRQEIKHNLYFGRRAGLGIDPARESEFDDIMKRTSRITIKNGEAHVMSLDQNQSEVEEIGKRTVRLVDLRKFRGVRLLDIDPRLKPLRGHSFHALRPSEGHIVGFADGEEMTEETLAKGTWQYQERQALDFIKAKYYGRRAEYLDDVASGKVAKQIREYITVNNFYIYVDNARDRRKALDRLHRGGYISDQAYLELVAYYGCTGKQRREADGDIRYSGPVGVEDRACRLTGWPDITVGDVNKLVEKEEGEHKTNKQRIADAASQLFAAPNFAINFFAEVSGVHERLALPRLATIAVAATAGYFTGGAVWAWAIGGWIVGYPIWRDNRKSKYNIWNAWIRPAALNARLAWDGAGIYSIGAVDPQVNKDAPLLKTLEDLQAMNRSIALKDYK